MNESSAGREPIEALAEEFLERHRRGEQPAVSEYTRQYPKLAGQIEELFPALLMMEGARPGRGDAERPPVSSEPPLKQFGDFCIIREIGRGGMGVVYEAEQESLGRRVALKVLPRQALPDAREQKRFVHEARAAARLHHTNIVPVFGVGEHDGVHYYAMQFINGLGLDKVLRELRRLRPKNVAADSPVRASIDGQHEPAVTIQQAPAGGDDATVLAVAQSLISGCFAEPRRLVESSSADLFLSGRPLTPADERPSANGRREVRPGPLPPARGRGADGSSHPPSTTAVARLSETLAAGGAFLLPGQSGSGSHALSTRATYFQSVARIGVQISQALAYAHAHGVLHRDIKPSNLLLDTHGTVWVTDFGLAKSEDQENITRTGDIVGTVRYMAPECFTGKTDERSDVYSLGLTLYELLALKPAYDAPLRHELIKQVLHEAPPRLRTLDPSIPRDLETIVHKSIDRDPSHRYQSAAELSADLERFVGDEPIRARRISPLARLQRWCKRNKAIAGLTGAIALLMVVSVIVSGVAAVSFRELANSNARLAGEKQDALTGAIKAGNDAREKQTEAETARKDAEGARREAEDQRNQLSQNVDLALLVLEQVYLQFAEQRFTQDSQLDETDRRFLEQALSFYEAFARQKQEDDTTRQSLARAAYRIGVIYKRLKQFDKSEVSLNRSIDLWSVLVAAEPESIPLREGLLLARSESAHGLKDFGQISRSRPVFHEIIDGWQKLAAAAPGTPVYRQHLGWAHVGLGDACERLAERDQAEAQYRQGAAVFEALTRESPQNSYWRYCYAHALNYLGNLQRGGEQAEDAEATLVDVISRYEQIFSEDPEREDAALALATGQRTVGTILKDSGRSAEAEKTFREEVEQRRRLVEMAPHDAAQRYELAFAVHQLGHLYRALGRHVEERRCWEEVVRIMDSVAEWYPENRYYQGFRADCLSHLGFCCYDLKQFREAERHLTRSLHNFDAIVKPADNSHWTHVVSHAHYYLALLTAEDQREAVAEQHHRASVDFMRQASHMAPNNQWYARQLVRNQQAFGDFLAKRNRFDEAIEAYQQAISSGEAVVERFGERQQDVASARWRLAAVLGHAGKPDEARQLARLALESLPNASLDFKIRISTPGLYRLYLRGGGRNGNDDSAYVRVVELTDGSRGEIADWYYVGEHWGESSIIYADFSEVRWTAIPYHFEDDIHGNSPNQPALWEFQHAGDYTLRLLMREDGFALDRLVLQLASLPAVEGDGPAESSRTDAGVFLEEQGRVAAEAEHFSARADGVTTTRWRVVPDEHAGHGWRNPSAGKYVQVLPDSDSVFSGMGFELAISDGDLEHHLARLTRQCELVPDDIDLIAARAGACEQGKDYEAAVADYTRLTELDVSNADWWRRRSMAQWKNGKYDQAIADMERSFELRQSLVDAGERRNIAYNNSAWALLSEPPTAEPRHYETILAWARRANRDFPDRNFSWSTLGLACYRTGRHDEARDVMRIAILLRGSSSNFGTRYAMTLAGTGDRLAARKWLELSMAWKYPAFQQEAADLLGVPLESIEPPAYTDQADLLTQTLTLEPDFAWAYQLRAQLHEAAGRKAEARADRLRAVEAWGRLIDTIPETVELARQALHLERGKLLWELEDHERARDDFNRVVELNPESVSGWNLRGIMHNRLGDHEQALADYSKAIDLKPNDHVLLGNRAHTHMLLKRHREAAADWAGSLGINPGNQRSRRGLADARFHLSLWQQAAADYSGLIEDDAEAAVVRLNRGQCYLNLGRWDEALADFGKCIELDPQNVVPRRLRTITLRRMGRDDDALAAYRERIGVNPTAVFINELDSELVTSTWYLRRFPEVAIAWEQRGHLCSFRQEPGPAEAALSQAIQLQPGQARFWLARGRHLLRQKRYEDAAADALEALRCDPASSALVSELAQVHADGEQWPQAKAILASAINAGTTNYRPYYELALVQLATGDAAGYRQTCAAALNKFRDAEDPTAANFVAWTCSLAPQALEDYAPAIALARRAAGVVDDPLSLMHQNTLGAILFRAGHYVEALEVLQALAGTFEESPASQVQTSPAYTWKLLAMVCERLGLPDDAAGWHARAEQPAQADPPQDGQATPRANPPWNRRVTLSLLGAEADAIRATAGEPPSQVALRERALYSMRDTLKSMPQTAEAWAAVGDAVRQQQRWPEAAAVFTEAIRLAPDEFLHYHRRGEVHLARGENDQAAADFSEAIHRKPDHAWSWWGRAQAHARRKLWKEALTDCTRAIELEPQAGFYQQRSWMHRELGEYDQAIHEANLAIQQDPDRPGGYWERSWGYRHKSMWAEALADLNKAIELRSDRPAWYRVRGQTRRDIGDLEGSLADYNEAVRLDPADLGAYSGRAETHMRLKNYEQAIADCTKALELNPTHAFSYHQRSRAWTKLGQHEQARADANAATQADPQQFPPVLQVRGTHHAALGEWNQAAADFSTALDRLPIDAEWGSPRKRLCAQLAQWDAVFESLAAERPNDHDLWIGRGRFHLLHNRWPDAAQCYARMIDERFVNECLEYAGLLLLTGEFDAYHDICRRVVARHGVTGDSAAALPLARLCGLTAGAGVEPARLVEWAELAAGEDPKPWHLNALGLAYFRAGQFDQAIARLQESNSMKWGAGISSVLNELVLAMAYHHRGDESKARGWLAKANVAIEQAEPFTPDNPFVTPPMAWVQIHVLLREAERLIDAPSSPTPD